MPRHREVALDLRTRLRKEMAVPAVVHFYTWMLAGYDSGNSAGLNHAVVSFLWRLILPEHLNLEPLLYQVTGWAGLVLVLCWQLLGLRQCVVFVCLYALLIQLFNRVTLQGKESDDCKVPISINIIVTPGRLSGTCGSNSILLPTWQFNFYQCSCQYCPSISCPTRGRAIKREIVTFFPFRHITFATDIT